jgi:hypothetical protein
MDHKMDGEIIRLDCSAVAVSLTYCVLTMKSLANELSGDAVRASIVLVLAWLIFAASAMANS